MRDAPISGIYEVIDDVEGVMAVIDDDIARFDFFADTVKENNRYSAQL